MSNTEKPQKKNRGRPKNKDYLPWADARELVRGERLPSRGKYFDWWDQNKPKTVPRYPYRVYREEWTSWNDFLGTDNEFRAVKKTFRPYNEALVYVHGLALESHEAWIKHCKEKGLPEDIPTHPELIYKEWTSWKHWLGNRAVEKLEAAREAHTAAIYYIIQHPAYPPNVFTFGIEMGGISGLKAKWQRSEQKFSVLKIFRYKREVAPTIQQIVTGFSYPYYDDDRTRIVPNIWEIVTRLQALMSDAK